MPQWLPLSRMKPSCGSSGRTGARRRIVVCGAAYLRLEVPIEARAGALVEDAAEGDEGLHGLAGAERSRGA